MDRAMRQSLDRWLTTPPEEDEIFEANEFLEEEEDDEVPEPCDQCGQVPCKCPDENPWDRDPTYGLSWRGGGR